MKRIFKKALFGLLILILILYFFIGTPSPAEEITWGVDFSQKHAENLGLDWKETYSSLLDDLGVKNLKIAVPWDILEPEPKEYNFESFDWQIKKAEEKGANLLLVIGMKTPRWPECHIPEWAKNLEKSQQQERILEMLEEIVLRYKDSPAIKYWQVENEPLLPFGDCPWRDNEFLKKEVNLVKTLDNQKRPVIISAPGELSFWIRTAKIGDIVGTTLYKKVWFRQIGFYLTYPLPSVFYWRKSQIIKKLFNKEVICIELQAEPWGKKLLYDSPIEEQKKTMDLEQFKKNVEWAKRTGLKEFYLWGGEWWYWMKEKQNKPEIWNEARKLFIQ